MAKLGRFIKLSGYVLALTLILFNVSGGHIKVSHKENGLALLDMFLANLPLLIIGAVIIAFIIWRIVILIFGKVDINESGQEITVDREPLWKHFSIYMFILIGIWIFRKFVLYIEIRQLPFSETIEMVFGCFIIGCAVSLFGAWLEKKQRK